MNDKWEIRIDEDKFFFTRFSEAKLHECYAPVSKDKAAVYLAAIIHGFQPPRALARLDRLSD